MHFICVNVFSAKVLIEDTTFTYPTRDRTACHFMWSSESSEGLAECSAWEVLSFLSYFKILSIDPAPGIEPATSHSAVKRSTDCSYPAAVATPISS